jgi:signal transduction histidine kinase/ActR/RegA family two-component response regulator
MLPGRMAEPRGAERSKERATPGVRWLERQTGRFVRAEVLEQGGERLRRSRLVARVCLILVTVSAVLALFTLLRQDYSFLAANLGLLGLVIGGLLFLRRGARAELVAMVLVGALYLAFVLGAIERGGIHSQPAQMLLIVPLLARFLAGRRAGAATFALVSVTFVLLGVYGPGEATLNPIASLLIINIVIVLVASAFELGSQEARRELDEANTELMATNADLVAARDAAELTLATRSAFLAAVSHEVRTPMSGILGVTDLLMQSALDAQQREQVELIRHSGEAILVITSDVLDFSKLDADKVQLEHVELDVVRVVEEALSLMRPRAQAKGLRLSSSVESRSMPGYLGDPGRLRQVLLNLVSNAIKFTDAGAIDVRAFIDVRGPAVDHVRFEVRDTGIGLTADQQAVIFEAFAQGDSSTARRYGGTGLGLAISTNLVALMGGELRVDSALGRGSTFRFTIALPQASPQVAQGRQSDSLLVSPDASSVFARAVPLSVLLAEDDVISRKVVKSLLERLGCSVDAVEDGEAAVEAVSTRGYDVVLMDCELPRLSGFEATARIRVLPEPACHTAVIAMTGHAMQGDRERCLEAGMNDYLSKPVRRRALITALRPYLRHLPADQSWDTLA